ncbi:MAG: SDR family oxidoreductase [Candidatus Aminicenantes bacterium]|nr:SDR family oxidoreductase [Candidatus Aminicenantes bacterium]
MNVFITGGSRGIGRAVVLKFVKEGWGCAFTYARDKEAAEETVKLASGLNEKADIRFYRLDVKEPERIESLADKVIEDYENIRAVVNNAAVVRNNAAVLMSNEEWEEVLTTNLSGPFYVIRSFLMHFVSNKAGRIINISSLAQDGCSGQVNYAASKAGLIGLTRTLAKEYGPKGITSNVVTVGYVPTRMTEENLAANLHEFWMKHCPLKRIGSAEDIANLVYYLCSDQGGFINGEVIRVSGGLTYAP